MRILWEKYAKEEEREKGRSKQWNKKEVRFGPKGEEGSLAFRGKMQMWLCCVFLMREASVFTVSHSLGERYGKREGVWKKCKVVA